MVMTNLTIDSPVQAPRVRSVRRQETPRWKRLLDLSVVILITPLLAVLFAAVAIFIRCVSRGPVFFLQSRVGHGGKDFRIIKFRTMTVSKSGRDASHREYVSKRAIDGGALAKPDHRNQLIPGGEILRKLSIDELPQIWNVLKGEMSLVGPRPDLLRLEDYDEEQSRRFEVLPGMTGLWQVSGKNSLSFDQMIELDIRYVETMSLSQDLKIIAKTFLVLLKERNE